MEAESIAGLLREAGRLKRIRRTGWVESGVRDPESVADHSYRTALLAMLLADAEGLDALRTVRMALLHDIAESRVGDLTPAMKRDKPDWRAEEDDAMEAILRPLGEPYSSNYLTLWREYLEAKTPEARLANAADKIEMLLQAREYEEAGNDPTRLMRFHHVSVDGDLEKRLEEKIKRE